MLGDVLMDFPYGSSGGACFDVFGGIAAIPVPSSSTNLIRLVDIPAKSVTPVTMGLASGADIGSVLVIDTHYVPSVLGGHNFMVFGAPDLAPYKIGLYDLTTSSVTAATTVTDPPAKCPQWAAFDEPSNVVTFITTTTGCFYQFNLFTYVATKFTPASLSGLSLFAVTNNTAISGNMIFACSDGDIREYNSSGTLVNTIALSSTYGAPVSMVIDTAGAYLYVGTVKGFLLKVAYPSGTIADFRCLYRGQANQIVSSVRSVNIRGDYRAGILNNFFSVALRPVATGASIGIWNANTPMMQVDEVIYPAASTSSQPSMAFDAQSNSVCINWDNIFTVYGCSGLSSNSTADTRTQSGGSDVASRVIRVPRFKLGRQFVETDINEGAGVNVLAARYESIPYKEISITNSKAPGEKADARTFIA